MPVVRLYRARIEYGNRAQGWVYSFFPIAEGNTRTPSHQIRVVCPERFYVETPPGYSMDEVGNERFVHGPKEGDEGRMDAARVMLRTWRPESGFSLVSTYENEYYDQQVPREKDDHA